MCVMGRSDTTLGMGIAKMRSVWFLFLPNYQIKSSPPTLLRLLSCFAVAASRASVHGAESFITYFVRVFFFLNSRLRSPSGPSSLFKRNVFSLSRQKVCQRLGGPPQKCKTFSKRVRPVIQVVSKTPHAGAGPVRALISTMLFLCNILPGYGRVIISSRRTYSPLTY